MPIGPGNCSSERADEFAQGGWGNILTKARENAHDFCSPNSNRPGTPQATVLLIDARPQGCHVGQTPRGPEPSGFAPIRSCNVPRAVQVKPTPHFDRPSGERVGDTVHVGIVRSHPHTPLIEAVSWTVENGCSPTSRGLF